MNELPCKPGQHEPVQFENGQVAYLAVQEVRRGDEPASFSICRICLFVYKEK